MRLSQMHPAEAAHHDAEWQLAAYHAALDEHAIVATTDARGIITYANDKFCAISQYTREELLGADHRLVSAHHHPPAYISALWTAIRSGRIWHGEFMNRAKDGSHFWVDTTIVPVLRADGTPQQYIAIQTDITAAKHTQAALADAASRLSLATVAAHIGIWE